MNTNTTDQMTTSTEGELTQPQSQIEIQKSKISLPFAEPQTPALTLSDDPPSNLSLVVPPVSSAQATALINAKPVSTALVAPKPGEGGALSGPCAPRKIRRNGRIASLPKVHRDMVNRMLWNAVPYKNIVGALSEADFTVTERNISNWATGGYLEWRLEQEAVLANRLDQDHLVDFLRRDDAHELPEVGLQAAATRLSQVLLQKLAGADDPEAHLDNYTKLIDLLCRLNREIAVTQKLRDDSRRTLGKEHDPVFVKDVEHVDAIEFERHYSDPGPDSKLPKPAEPPMLPPIPTATFLAQQAREERTAEEYRRAKYRTELLRACRPKKADSNSPQNTSTTSSNGTSTST